MFYFFRGIYHAYVATDDGKQLLVHTYNNKGSFGELALMYNMPRAATIKAETKGFLWAMDRLTFRRIVLKSAFKKRKMYEALIDNVPMLKALQVCYYLTFDAIVFVFIRYRLQTFFLSALRTYEFGRRAYPANVFARRMYNQTRRCRRWNVFYRRWNC